MTEPVMNDTANDRGSFPERQDTEATQGLSFHFTIRNTSPDIPLVSPCAPYGSSDDFYGHCVFHQEYDQTTKRSFNQRTLLLVSTHDFPKLFTTVLERLVSASGIGDPTILEAACTQISAWPSPSVGRHELPFMGFVFSFEVVPHPAFPLQGLSSFPLAATLMTVSPIYAYQPTGSWSSLMHLMPSISELRTVFEALLLCKSVVVLAKSPQSCSECVSLLLDIIRPVPYAGIVRPYITMQSDFTALGLDGGLPHSYIAGITNPFLLQRLLTAPKNRDRSKPHVVYLHHQFDDVPPMKPQSLRHQRSHPDFDVPGGLELEASTKKYTKADNTFHKELNRMLRRDPSDIDEVDSIIRHHFAELAAQFVAPINRYLATSMSSSVISPGGNLQYGNFNEADFLYSLSKYGTAVKFKGQTPLQKHRARDAMYTDFCRSSNFYSWLDMKLSLEKESAAGLL